MKDYLAFEKPLADIDKQINELRMVTKNGNMPGASSDIERLQKKAHNLLISTYKKLTPWHKTLISRHPERPRFRHYVNALIQDFTPLSGDRTFADDNAIIGGLGWLGKRAVMVIGQEKGHDTETRIRHNFGMAHPEGYRKATRLIKLAGRFAVPVLTFIDTPGAYPGIGAEERGQAEAIARCTEACLALEAPLITLVIGEGGSGGAIALAAANRILMLEHAIYTVASPEAAAAILWRNPAKAEETAAAMKITAQALHKNQLIDRIIEEPIGGAHRNAAETLKRVEIALQKELKNLLNYEGFILRKMRRDKFLAMGRIKA